ncbi:polyprenyl synthetase family protein [Jeotgalibacillus soli]|uniref:Farnesyl diphosphate synthase n=1 Tax=Jeotgalibacillus soli TaxID=889306 RepID=A0A0C2V5T3_9BACL|nr:farnesyl diphosphate synthase [Jeotgalibacillus soli]KIL44352.1 farnesyl-diphosphate synthase [Jeotgalibacillus soli]
MTGLTLFIETYKKQVEETMLDQVKELNAPSTLRDAMVYSLEAGGKRIRPILLLATIDAFGLDCKIGLMPAAALEMVHTYSLIHDDLPSMDDDDLRRGKPTNHKIFGEAHAILAGDALLTESFRLISMMDHATAEQKVSLITELATAAGAIGMVGGQVADLEGENSSLTLPELESIHERKTGHLLIYSVIAGGILSGATQKQIEQLHSYAYHIGLAFQIRDDILDVEGDEQEIGKPIGSDISNNKSTYPALLGMDGAKQKLEHHLIQAKEALSHLPLQNNLLSSIADLIVERRS